MAGGVFFALDLSRWHVGIGLTRLGNAALFGNSGSLILMVWGFIVVAAAAAAARMGSARWRRSTARRSSWAAASRSPRAPCWAMCSASLAGLLYAGTC